MATQSDRKPIEHLGLRLIVTIGAVAIVILRAVLPDLLGRIDAIALGLLILAVVPWLTPFIKSIEISGIGKIELLERRLENVEGAVSSATKLAAVSGISQPIENAIDHRRRDEPPVRQLFRNLAFHYNEIREKQKSGPHRTSNMTNVVRQMIELAPMLEDYDPEKDLRSEDRGVRLGAYAYLYACPVSLALGQLIDSITEIEDKPFGQYWGIMAVQRVLEEQAGATISGAMMNKLSALLERLRPNTDRAYELRKVFQILEDTETD